MEKNKSLEWIKEKFETGKEEVVKLTKIGKLRIEITSLNKKKEERLLEIGKKAYQLVLDGKISEEYFEPDYSSVIGFEEKIQELIDKIEEIKIEDGTTEDEIIEEAEVVETSESDEVENKEEVTETDDEEKSEPIVMGGEVEEEEKDKKEEK